MNVPGQRIGIAVGVAPFDLVRVELELLLPRDVARRGEQRRHDPAEFLLVPDAHMTRARGHQRPVVDRVTARGRVFVRQAQ